MVLIFTTLHFPILQNPKEGEHPPQESCKPAGLSGLSRRQAAARGKAAKGNRLHDILEGHGEITTVVVRSPFAH